MFESVKLALDPTGASRLVHVQGTPKQDNGYDCGIYVLATAESVCAFASKEKGDEWYLKRTIYSVFFKNLFCLQGQGTIRTIDPQGWEDGLQAVLGSQAIQDFRIKLLNLICRLRQLQNAC